MLSHVPSSQTTLFIISKVANATLYVHRRIPVLQMIHPHRSTLHSPSFHTLFTSAPSISPSSSPSSSYTFSFHLPNLTFRPCIFLVVCTSTTSRIYLPPTKARLAGGMTMSCSSLQFWHLIVEQAQKHDTASLNATSNSTTTWLHKSCHSGGGAPPDV